MKITNCLLSPALFIGNLIWGQDGEAIEQQTHYFINTFSLAVSIANFLKT
ncbi:MAG: hypothetical protein WKG06_39115 [Segetibacter sp.]